MSRAALLAAALLSPTPPASVDFGAVELGTAARHSLRVPAAAVSASGAGFSATRTRDGVLVVFEPYELGEEARGALRLTMRSGRLVRLALRGHGIDTIPPTVTVAAPHSARAGRPLAIVFAATDNDLVAACTLEAGRRVIARLGWPATTFSWRVPVGFRGSVRITVVARDRAGNRASASSGAILIR